MTEAVHYPVEKRESRSAKIKRLREEIVRLGTEMEELSQMGPERFEEMEGYQNLFSLAKEAVQNTTTELAVMVRVKVRLTCNGGLYINPELDIDKYNAFDDTEAEYDIYDEAGDIDHDKLIGKLPEVVNFCKEAKIPYAQYAAAFNAFCELHELDSEERDELWGWLDEKLNPEECDDICPDEDYDEDDDEDDDIPF